MIIKILVFLVLLVFLIKSKKNFLKKILYFLLLFILLSLSMCISYTPRDIYGIREPVNIKFEEDYFYKFETYGGYLHISLYKNISEELKLEKILIYCGNEIKVCEINKNLNKMEMLQIKNDEGKVIYIFKYHYNIKFKEFLKYFFKKPEYLTLEIILKNTKLNKEYRVKLENIDIEKEEKGFSFFVPNI